MKLTKRGEYALRALIDFGIAHELGRPLVKIGELVEKERLPVKFLEQILMQFREAGYIEAKRGKTGRLFSGQAAGGDPLWPGHPAHRWPAGADRLREPDGLRALYLPG